MLEEELVNDDDALEEQQTFTFLPRKKKRTATFRYVITPSEVMKIILKILKTLTAIHQPRMMKVKMVEIMLNF